MSIYDVNNPPAVPDSTLDSDTSLEAVFTVQGDLLVAIAPGDWVDVDPSVMPADPNWGFSFQVSNVYPNENPNLQQVGVQITQDDGATYFEVGLDTRAWVQNNFRRVPNS